MKKIISALLCLAMASTMVFAMGSSASAQGGFNATLDDLDIAPIAEQPPITNYGAISSFTGNVALNSAATSSGLEVAGQWTEDLAVDGIKDTDASRWSAPNMKTTSPQTPQWLMLDLFSEVTDITEINIYFYKKVWPMSYEIQTRATSADEWRTVKTITHTPADTLNITDSFTDITALDRFVRFYFNTVNTNAGGDSVSVREIEIFGTALRDDNPAPASATAVMNTITSLSLNEDKTAVVFPTIHSDYEFSIKGSENDYVIAADGSVANHVFADTEVTLLAQIVNKNNETDRAEKNFTLTVQNKRRAFPSVFPEVTNPNAEPAVIPSVQEWYGYNGNFTLNSETAIHYLDEDNSDDMYEVAQNLHDDILEMFGYDLIMKESADIGENIISISTDFSSDDPYDLGDEGSLMIVNDNGVQIEANTYTGALYATFTLEQQLSTDNCKTFPYGVIRDYPKFEVRGVMVDIARSPFRLELLEQYQKTLSWFKINELHMHINDNRFSTTGNEGSYDAWSSVPSMFRLECDTFPSLTTTTVGGEFYNDPDGYGTAPSYTKEEWVAFQERGKKYSINVITEIDAPGHALAFNTYVKNYPEEAAAAGITGPVYNPRSWELLALDGDNYANAKKFLELLFDEYVGGDDETFISDTVHIGADEYWNITASEKAGMKDYILDTHEFLTENGKTTRLWAQTAQYLEGVVDTKLYNDIELDLWSVSYDNVARRISEGYSIINVDNNYLYNNPLRNRRDIVNIEHLYENWNPYIFSNYTVPTGEPAIRGAKTAVWSDITDMGVTETDETERIIRSAAVLAEKTWDGTDDSQTYADFSFIFSKLKNGPVNANSIYYTDTDNTVLDYDFSYADSTTVYNRISDINNATVNGNITYTTDSDGTVWANFDGNSYLTTDLRSLSYPYTVSFDIKTGTQSGAGELFKSSDTRLNILPTGELSIDRSYHVKNTGYSIPKNKTTNITIVGTQQATKIYQDGVLVKFLGRLTDGSETEFNYPASTFIFPLSKIGNGFVGQIANLRAYTKAFSPETIKNIANGTAINYVNVSQNKGVAGDAQNIGLGNWDVGWKKINVGWKAIDGDSNGLNGEHSSQFSEINSFFEGAHADSSIAVDLWSVCDVSKITLEWDNYPSAFKLQTSTDGKTWVDVQTVTGNTKSVTSFDFATPLQTRYIKMQGVTNNGNTFKLREFMVFESVDKSALSKAMYTAQGYVNTLNLTDLSALTAKQSFIAAQAAQAISNNPFALQESVDAQKDTITTAVYDEFDVVKGDTNFDGKVNIKDATVVQKYTVNLIGDDKINHFTDDVNNDSEVNSNDTVHIQKYLARLISEM